MPSELDPMALEALKNHQRQLDADGCEVGVSRQALDELIAAYEDRTSIEEAEPVAWRYRSTVPGGKQEWSLTQFPQDVKTLERQPKMEVHPLFAHPAPSGMGVNGPTDPRHFQILVEAMAEVKATSDGKSDQPIADIVHGCIDEINALPPRQALIPPVGSDTGEENWRDDPSADERWNAGLDYGQTQLCKVLGVDPQTVTWDAATETLDGDVQAVIGKILTARFGDDWPSNLSQPLPADERVVEALREALAREWTNFCDANPDDLTSPEDLPDHALMTCEQFVEYAMFAFSTQEAKP